VLTVGAYTMLDHCQYTVTIVFQLHICISVTESAITVFLIGDLLAEDHAKW
jgi:hypothetical protein